MMMIVNDDNDDNDDDNDDNNDNNDNVKRMLLLPKPGTGSYFYH